MQMQIHIIITYYFCSGRPGDLIHAMDLFEADVVLTLKQKVMLEKQRRKHDIHKRAVITDLTEKWKNRVVPYTIASSLGLSIFSVTIFWGFVVCF